MKGPMHNLLSAADPALACSDRLGDVVEVLAGLDLAGPQEATRAVMVAFAAEHANALLRSSEIGHFTGSAFVVDADAQRTLMLLHRKVQRWLQPGGHADGDANLAAVALKEATEETGIEGLRVDPRPVDLDIHRFVSANETRHLHFDVRFLVVAPRGAVEQRNHESEELRWVTEAELPGLGVHDELRRLAQVGFARARQSG
jgi:8-oxo-dGTP pyrophosphatase MutT (NUDIX family)